MSVKSEEISSGMVNNPALTIKQNCYQCIKGPANIITTLVVVVCIVASCVQVANCIRKIFLPPISTFTHFDFNDTLLYPAVTFCRDPPYKFKELGEYGLYAHPIYTSVWRTFDFEEVTLDELWNRTTYKETEYFLQLGLNHDRNNIEIVPTVGFVLGLCYTLKPKILLTTATKQTGYSVLLQHSAEDVATSTSIYPPGYHVYIHSNNEPFTEVQVPGQGLVDYMYVNIGEEIDIKLTVNEYIKIGRAEDRCWNGAGNYSASECTTKRLWKEIESSVGCSGPWMISDLPRCKNYTEMRNLIAAYTSSYDSSGIGYKCPRLCQAVLYQGFVTSRQSSATWNHSEQTWVQRAGDAILQTQLYIHFNSMMVTVFDERFTYDFSLFLADLGGSVGFLLGLSVIGVIQILGKMWKILIHPIMSAPKPKKSLEDSDEPNRGIQQSTPDCDKAHQKCEDWNTKNYM